MDPIKYIFENPALTGRITIWQMLLSEYDIESRSQKAIKGSVLDDHLAHQPIEDYQSVQYDFPDEKIMYLNMKGCDDHWLKKGQSLVPVGAWYLIELLIHMVMTLGQWLLLLEELIFRLQLYWPSNV